MFERLFDTRLLLVAIVLLSGAPLHTSYAEDFDEVYHYRTKYGTDDDINKKLFHYYLDLSHPGLEEVKEAVDADNYVEARARLLAYYELHAKRDDTGGGQYDTAIGDMMVDDLYTWSDYDYRVAELSVPQSASEIVVDVTDDFKGTFPNERASYMIMGKDKKHAAGAQESGWSSISHFLGFPFYNANRPHYVQLSTREHADHKPMLRLTINGQETTIIADKDTFIRYGHDNNYGQDTWMEVRASGLPFNEYESRSFLSFDVSSVSIGNANDIQSAKLVLYGRIQDAQNSINTNDFENVYLFRTNDRKQNWSESGFSDVDI